MLSDPICALICGVMLVLLALTALRAMRTVAISRADRELARREILVARVVRAVAVGEPEGGEISVDLRLQIPYPPGSTTELEAVRRLGEGSLERLAGEGAVVIVEFDPQDPAGVQLRLDMTPAGYAFESESEPPS